MDNLAFYASQIIDGLAYGGIYGLFALSIVILYRANKLFNFAQTEIATLCVIGMVFLLQHVSFSIALSITLVGSFLLGGFLHLTLMRIVTERRKILHSNEAVMTIGFFSIFNSVSSYLAGDEPKAFPSPFGSENFLISGISISHISIGILAVTVGFAILIYLGFRHTQLGIIFEAVAENPVAARIRGIRASNMLALAWGLTIMTSAIGAVLIAPALFVSPSMLIGIYSYSLISVIIGGLESPIGALVGGMIVGVVENLASNIPGIGSDLKFIAVFALLLLVLFVRPRGLWGRQEARRI